MKKISDIQNPYLQKNAALADRKENGGNQNGYIDNYEPLLFSSLSIDMLKQRSILKEYQEVIGIEFDSPEMSSEVKKLRAELMELNYNVDNINSLRLQLIAKKADLLRNGGNGDNKLNYDEALFFTKEAFLYLEDEENMKEFKKILKLPSDEELMKIIKPKTTKRMRGYQTGDYRISRTTKSRNMDVIKAAGTIAGITVGAGIGLSAFLFL